MPSNSSAGQSGRPAATSVMPPISKLRIGALDPAQRAELVDQLDEFAQILVHPAVPNSPRSASNDIRRRALW